MSTRMQWCTKFRWKVLSWLHNDEILLTIRTKVINHAKYFSKLISLRPHWTEIAYYSNSSLPEVFNGQNHPLFFFKTFLDHFIYLFLVSPSKPRNLSHLPSLLSRLAQYQLRFRPIHISSKQQRISISD